MSTTKPDTSKLTPQEMEIVDPLGEIRGEAKKLWREAGCPEGSDWTEFWEVAEEIVLGKASKK